MPLCDRIALRDVLERGHDAQLRQPSQVSIVDGAVKRMMVAILFTGVILWAPLSVGQSNMVVHRFQGGPNDGATPSGGVIFGTSGFLGTSSEGGCATNDCGVLYKLRPPTTLGGAWTGAGLHTFGAGEGPTGELILTGSRILGGTRFGGTHGYIYELSQVPRQFRSLFDFSGQDGEEPNGGFVFLAERIVGTTSRGGSSQSGVVFALTLSTGAIWKNKTLYNFTGGPDGGFPTAGLVFGFDNAAYGTTPGGTGTAGTVFRVTLPSRMGPSTFSTVYTLSGATDGASPAATLTTGADGSLYGTTEFGGDPVCNCGTVFKLTPPSGAEPWTFTTLYTFKGDTDGANPQSALVFDSTGALFGTAPGGGNLTCGVIGLGGCGVVFKLTPPASDGEDWTQSVYYTFQGGSDGIAPTATPLLLDGNIYGTTVSGGGQNNGGTVFEITP